jgi:outer membrane protein OmpA-like peptidoglycan-associated protein
MKFSKIVAAISLVVGTGVASADDADSADKVETGTQPQAQTQPYTRPQAQTQPMGQEHAQGMTGEKATKKEGQAPAAVENKRACKSAEVFFKFDSAKLSADDATVLQPLVDELNKYEGTTIVLDGFTDPRGSEAYNVVLSGKRADAVRQKLISMGAPQDRIVLGLHGKTGELRASFPEDRRVTAWITRNTTKQIVNHELENGAQALVWGDQMKTIAVLGGEQAGRIQQRTRQQQNRPGEG